MFYIHIPFCDSKCHYCAFNSYTDLEHLQSNYLQSLIKQIKHDLNFYQIAFKSSNSLFIGGGTPSTYPAQAFEQLLSILTPYLKDDAEITIEANPNSATLSWLTDIRALGIKRISFGTQSFNSQKLKLLGRAHNAQDALNAIENAHKLGIPNISLDFIYGTKFDTNSFITKELSLIPSLPINHVSCYNLIIEEGTPFAKNPALRVEREENYEHVKSIIESHNLPQYEVANFGTYQSQHNKGYWAGHEYLGFGAGAVGTMNNVRTYPHKDLEQYIKDPLFKDKEILTPDDTKIERILLGLRSIVGFKIDELTKEETRKIKILEKEEKVFIEDQRVKAKSLFLADEIALFISN